MWYHSQSMTSGPVTSHPLVLSPGLRDVVAGRARRAYPHEACGLLVGRREVSAVVVEHVARARNLLRAGDRYELAPEDWCEAWRDAELRQGEIVGVWHSHPDHRAVPSRTDLETAWAEYSYLIASVSTSGVSQLRCWQLTGCAFQEQPVVGGKVS